jgi:DNA-binding CsgD family transcriptional regulator/tetratricopeptide (TPR) repeat protein
VYSPDTLVGRHTELDVIRDLVKNLAGGEGRVLWVEGEPGIGKSALLAVAWAEAQRLGCHGFRARAEELAQRFPLRVLLDGLDPKRALVPSRQPDTGPEPVLPADPVMAAVEAMVRQVEGLCAEAPVILVLDDLQWADEASVLVWHRLSRLVGQLPLLLVTACGPAPRLVQLAQLRRGVLAAGAVLITLEPLPDHAVDELVENLTGGVPGPRLRQFVRNAGGNPLYVRELIDARRHEGGGLTVVDRTVVEVPGGAAAVDTPAPLAMVINDRLDRLSDQARELLRTAALLGVKFSVSDLVTVSGLAPSAMIVVIEEAVGAGVLVKSGTGLGFRHGLIQRALYERLPAGLRAALHRQAAQALEEAGQDVARVAEHLVVAQVADQWVIDWLARSADLLGSRAPHIAIELLERGIAALRPAAAALRADLEAQLATVMFQLGRYDEVEHLIRRALAGMADPAVRARLTWTLSYALLRRCRYDEALAAIDEVTALATAPGLVWQARLEALRSMVLANAGRLEEAEAAALSVLADRRVDPLAAGYALHAQFLAGTSSRDVDVAHGLLVTALTTIGEDPQAADLRVLLLANRACLTEDMDRLTEMTGAVADMLDAAERIGTPPRVAMARLTAADLWFLTGRWDDALAELETLIQDEFVNGHLPWLVRAHGLCALIAEHRDDDVAGDRHLDAMAGQDLSGGLVTHSSIYLRWARSVRAERRADHAGALAGLRTMNDLGLGHAFYFYQARRWNPDLVRLALACGDVGAAEAAAAAAASDARAGTPGLVAADEVCAGLVAGDAAPVLAAADRYRSIGRGFEQARALEEAAVLLSGAGDQTAAREAYLEAIDLYGLLGAAWDTRRVDARLRLHGLRRGQRGPRRRPATGWAALTPTELRVTGLVAQGMSNTDIAGTLFLSRRTVETHISHILSKLGARSRVEVVREAVTRAAG